MKYDVFISYRREGGDTLAQLIYDRLTHRGYQVFLDIESLSGGKFNEKLLEVIDECKDIIVILPPNALDRCHNEGDWLYREIEHGISMKKNIIPVMMKNFVWPDNIPEAIADIQNYNGILDNKDYFDAVIDKITTLLKSKPKFGGGFFNKTSERKRLLKQKDKKRKKLFVSIVSVALLFSVVFGGFYFKNKNALEKEKTHAEITLTASDEMSATEFHESIKIVEKRMEIFAEGFDYDYKKEDDKVIFQVPLDVFQDMAVDSTIKCYVSRPGNLYLRADNSKTTDGEAYLKIDRDCIDSVEVSEKYNEVNENTKQKLKGLSDGEKCKSYALKLKKDSFKEVMNWVNSDVTMIESLAYDVELSLSPYFSNYISGVDKEKSTIYFVDNYQYENIFDITKHNLENDTFEDAFLVKAKVPVNWEDIESDDCTPGKNQCNVEELGKDAIRVDFKTYDSQISEGKYLDILKILKVRLDTLETPYAFGTYVNEKFRLSIMIDAKSIDEALLGNMFASNTSFSIESNYYKLFNSYDTESIEIKKGKDGNYSLQIKPKDSWKDSDETAEWQEKLSEKDSAILYFGTVPISKMKLADMYDGTCFTFDNIYSYGLKKVDDNHRYLFNIIKVMFENNMLSSNYTLDSIFTNDERELEDIKFLEDVLSEKVKNDVESKIKKIPNVEEYSVEVTDCGQNVVVNLVVPRDKKYISNLNELTQKVYHSLKLSEGEIKSFSSIVRMDSLEGECILVSWDTDKEQHELRLGAFYHSKLSEDYIDEFEDMINEEEFYKQFYVAEWNIKEDGRVSFK